MLIQLVLLVIILCAITFAWKLPGSSRSGRASSGRGTADVANPFKGPHRTAPPRASHSTIDKGVMTRCHNCATFFPTGQVIHEVVEGHLLEFCSNNCRRNFLGPGR